MLEVNVFQTKRIIPTIAICKIIPVTIEQECMTKGMVIILSACIAKIGNYAVNLCGCQILFFILLDKKTPEILFDERISIFSVNIITECILPMRFVKKFDSCLLELAFVIFPFVCHNRCCLRMYDVLKQCRTVLTRKPVGFFGYLLCFVCTFVYIDDCTLDVNGRKRYFATFHICKGECFTRTSP